MWPLRWRANSFRGGLRFDIREQTRQKRPKSIIPQDVTVAPDPVVVTIDQPVPTITITITPDPLVVTLAMPTPDVSIGAAPDPVAVTITTPTPDIGIGVTPDPRTIPIVIPTPDGSLGIGPDPFGIPIGLPPPTIMIEITPDPVVVPIVLPTPTVQADQTITPDPIVIVIGLPVPTVTVTGVEVPPAEAEPDVWIRRRRRRPETLPERRRAVPLRLHILVAAQTGILARRGRVAPIERVRLVVRATIEADARLASRMAARAASAAWVGSAHLTLRRYKVQIVGLPVAAHLAPRGLASAGAQVGAQIIREPALLSEEEDLALLGLPSDSDLAILRR